MRTAFVISISAALSIVSSAAGATSQRTFVASTGNDANACSFTQPCRTFARAVTQTTTGGEVVALDSAGYGTVTITKALSIVAAPGAHASITAFNGDAVAINAPDSIVVLRGLTIIGQGGTNGVTFTGASLASSGFGLLIEDCQISGMSGAAVALTSFSSFHFLNAVIRHSSLFGNSAGIRLIGTLCPASGCPIEVVLETSAVAYNTVGVDYSQAEAASQSACSQGNNTFRFNGLDVSQFFTISPCPPS
jgi:nitrous oxidase accessory protein NosD